MKNNQDFYINTGAIYRQLMSDNKKLPFQDLSKVVRYLPFIVAEKMTGETMMDGMEYNYIIEISPIEFNKDSNTVYIPDGFVITTTDGQMEASLSYDNILTNDDTDFDLYFAIKFYLTDIMQSKDFLIFHEENTFEGDVETYKEFLGNLAIKYKEFLENKHEKIINKYLEKKSNPDFTPIRKVLAIHYLLEELRREESKGIDLINNARFIQFLTNIDIGTKQIKDSNLYEKVKNIDKQIKKASKEDWEFIYTHFSNLDLKPAILERIEQEKHKKN